MVESEQAKREMSGLEIPSWVEHLMNACEAIEAGFHFEEGGCFAMSMALHEALCVDFDVRIAVDDGAGHAVVLIDGIAIDHQGAKPADLSSRYSVAVEKNSVRGLAIACGQTGDDFDADLDWARKIIQAAKDLDFVIMQVRDVSPEHQEQPQSKREMSGPEL